MLRLQKCAIIVIVNVNTLRDARVCEKVLRELSALCVEFVLVEIVYVIILWIVVGLSLLRSVVVVLVKVLSFVHSHWAGLSLNSLLR